MTEHSKYCGSWHYWNHSRSCLCCVDCFHSCNLSVLKYEKLFFKPVDVSIKGLSTRQRPLLFLSFRRLCDDDTRFLHRSSQCHWTWFERMWCNPHAWRRDGLRRDLCLATCTCSIFTFMRVIDMWPLLVFPCGFGYVGSKANCFPISLWKRPQATYCISMLAARFDIELFTGETCLANRFGKVTV